MLEVEFKASLEGISPEHVDAERRALGFIPFTSLHEVDMYYNGCDRDFHRSDEALRLRSCTVLPDGPVETLLTYKGPKLDSVSSTRKEYEIAVSDAIAAQNLLEALGYQPVFMVEKVRCEYHLDTVTLCLDEVTGLGRFLELEELVPDDGSREAAEVRLLALLDRLAVPRDRLTRVSYLEMLMQKSKHSAEI